MKKFKNDLEIAKYLLKIEKKAFHSARKNKIDIKAKQSDKCLHDLVTNYDTTIERELIAQLHRDFDHPKIVSEEYNSGEEAKGTYFTIDPIDGTLNFANKINLWSVQVAYVRDDKIVASALYNPDTDSYYAALNFGAYKNGKRFFTEHKPIDRQLFTIPEDKDEHIKIIKAINEITLQYRRIGSASIALEWVAEGKVGAYILEKNTSSWDIYPGFLLASEAGGVIDETLGYIIVANDTDSLKRYKVMIEKAVGRSTKEGEKSSETKSKRRKVSDKIRQK